MRREKERKSKVYRLASLALLLTLITTCLLSSTLAKYTSSVSASDSARVAAWDFDGLGSGNNTIDIFKTAYDNKNGDTTVEAHNGTDKIIAPGTYGQFALQYKLNAEVMGKVTFNITETNSKNLPIVYVYNNPTTGNEEYYSDKLSGPVYLNLTDDPGAPTYTSITINGNLTGLATAINNNAVVILPNKGSSTGTQSIGLKWFWAFEKDGTGSLGNNLSDRDIEDTTRGKEAADEIYRQTAGAAATVKLDVTATAVQVD